MPRKQLQPLADRGPLRVLFCLTSMPVGGAETLLVNLVRRLDRERFTPEICCLKERGPLGEMLAQEIPVAHNLIHGKYDLAVLFRLTRLLRERRIDAIVTVGAGDKMFWGRLAAWRAGVPVVCSALHSTGWPDGVGRLNRLLTPLTDAFIGVATEHGRHLVERERFPTEKVRVIPNGVDTTRFQPRPECRVALRTELGVSVNTPLVGLVAALRPEKNHELFLRAARRVREQISTAQFVLVGDGPRREPLLEETARLGLTGVVRFLGTRSDIPQILAGLDAFALTSHMEANPVSILEAQATGLPIVSTDVGSVSETVIEGATGYLVPAGDEGALSARLVHLLQNPAHAQALGETGREGVVRRWSLERMVEGYERLITEIYERKCQRSAALNQRASGMPPQAEESLT